MNEENNKETDKTEALLLENIKTMSVMQHTVNNLIEGVKNMERKIEVLASDLDGLYAEDKTNLTLLSAVREIQDEVAKMANQPVGMMFVRRV